MSGKDYYGNGLLNYIDKSFCLDGVCEDVTVCKIHNDVGEENYYVPLDGESNRSNASI